MTIRKIDEHAAVDPQKLHVIFNLNSVSFIQLTHRLELDHCCPIYYEVGPDVSDVLTVVKNRDDTLRLIEDALFSQGDFECAVIDGFGVTRAERGPDVLGDRFHYFK